MWRIMIETLETGITSPALPTLAEIERQTEEPLAQPRTPTHLTDPASPPTAALPTPETRPRPNEPQHSLRSIFDQYALYGLAGEAVRTLAPHTEAQPEALLLQLLAAFGNLIGPAPHCMVGSTRHALNLFVVLVGESSKARKGTTGGRRQRRTRRIPLGGNLVRIVRTFKHFAKPMLELGFGISEKTPLPPKQPPKVTGLLHSQWFWTGAPTRRPGTDEK